MKRNENKNVRSNSETKLLKQKYRIKIIKGFKKMLKLNC